MFDWFRKLFGEGTARFEVVLDDGRTATVKMPYIGTWDLIDATEALENQILVDYGVGVKSVKFIGRTTQ